MRILLVAASAVPFETTASEQLVHALGSGMVRRGHLVAVIAPTLPFESYRMDGVSYQRATDDEILASVAPSDVVAVVHASVLAKAADACQRAAKPLVFFAQAGDAAPIPVETALVAFPDRQTKASSSWSGRSIVLGSPEDLEREISDLGHSPARVDATDAGTRAPVSTTRDASSAVNDATSEVNDAATGDDASGAAAARMPGAVQLKSKTTTEKPPDKIVYRTRDAARRPDQATRSAGGRAVVGRPSPSRSRDGGGTSDESARARQRIESRRSSSTSTGGSRSRTISRPGTKAVSRTTSTSSPRRIKR